jgi:hypothetical protein
LARIYRNHNQRPQPFLHPRSRQRHICPANFAISVAIEYIPIRVGSRSAGALIKIASDGVCQFHAQAEISPGISPMQRWGRYKEMDKRDRSNVQLGIVTLYFGKPNNETGTNNDMKCQ